MTVELRFVGPRFTLFYGIVKSSKVASCTDHSPLQKLIADLVAFGRLFIAPKQSTTDAIFSHIVILRVQYTVSYIFQCCFLCDIVSNSKVDIRDL